MAEKLSAALYIRLSKEDDRDGPSESVTNQRAMLEKYTSDHSISVFDTYIDDGWSGCSFDRPNFQRLIGDIEAGNVNMVITKDLSRLGRDYILTGHYLERYFPEHRVRYVSLLDGIDTGNNSSANDITPFRAIMNDMYARDISRKITSVKRDKQRRGQFIGGKPIYGYKMHPSEKNHIVIDETAAATVRQIFSMALAGTSCRQIAAVLNENSIPSPAVYAHLPLKKNTPRSGLWSGERISEMLQNETYLGNMVQGRRVKVSYKSKKSLRKNKEDWIVVEHTHEAIIDRPTFDAVQRLLSSRRHTRNRTYDFPLKGMVFCHECGHPLGVINRKNAAGEDTLYFVCRTYQRSTKSGICTSHCVKVNAITNIVTSVIFDLCSEELSEADLLPIAERTIRGAISSTTQTSLPALLTRHQQITAQIDNLCFNRLNEVIEQTDFERIYLKLTRQRELLSQQIAAEEKRNSPPDPETLSKKLTAQYIAGLPNDREFLTQLIERIELTAQKQLVITFRFARNEQKKDITEIPKET